jgi:hypothetical protein
MKASETKLQRVIEGTNQYVVPLFQRKYSWDTKEWNTLWEDLVELASARQSQDRGRRYSALCANYKRTCPCEIGRDCLTAMFFSDDVIDVERKFCCGFRKVTIFTASLRTADDFELQRAVWTGHD